MKSSLVLALFGIFLVLKNVQAEECRPIPGFFIKSMLQCFAKLEKEDQALLLQDDESEKREIKCFHLCILEKTGYFKDGQFSPEKMKETTRKYMPTEALAESVIAANEDSMLKAKEKEGDNCDIASEYFKINKEKEKKEPLVSKIFCSDDEEDESERKSEEEEKKE